MYGLTNVCTREQPTCWGSCAGNRERLKSNQCPGAILTAFSVRARCHETLRIGLLLSGLQNLAPVSGKPESSLAIFQSLWQVVYIWYWSAAVCAWEILTFTLKLNLFDENLPNAPHSVKAKRYFLLGHTELRYFDALLTGTTCLQKIHISCINC